MTNDEGAAFEIWCFWSSIYLTLIVRTLLERDNALSETERGTLFGYQGALPEHY